MHSPQIDLLSYAYIRTEVERLFKAYLDARLIALAKDHRTSPFEYWKGVVSLSESKLGWRKPGPKSAQSGESVDELLEQLDSKADDMNDPDTSPYLYWFDVRADYWSPVGDSKWASLVDALPSAAHLAVVFAEAQALKKRIETEQPYVAKPPTGEQGVASEQKAAQTSAKVAVVPPFNGLTKILEKVEDHPARAEKRQVDNVNPPKP